MSKCPLVSWKALVLDCRSEERGIRPRTQPARSIVTIPNASSRLRHFGVSGGLLRHQREVHKKNINAKKPLMCPYTDCNRSTGNGFTRQENLKEHLRRRHMHTENGPSAELPMVSTPDLDGNHALSVPPSVKRKRDSLDDDISVALPGDEENEVDLRNELKRLRREVQEKDRRLEELERIVAGLQQAIPQPTIPQTAVSQG